jgi:hypothetical protein
MKVWLDDWRPAPNGWISCRWPEEVIKLLQTNTVEEVSLDHDLADPDVIGAGYCSAIRERTGYDVLVWIEEQVTINDFNPPNILIHTANPSARIRMDQAVLRIRKLCKNS